MKHYILLPFIVLLAACQEDAPEPVKSYAGTYRYETADLEFTLHLVREHGILKGTSAAVTHDAITGSEGRDNVIIVHYGESNEAKERIVIRSPSPVYWSVELSKVRFTDEGMNVEELKVKMPGLTDFVISGTFISRLDSQ